MATFIYFSHVVSKFNLSINVTKNCNVMVICLFRKGTYEQCYHNAVDDYKIKV